MRISDWSSDVCSSELRACCRKPDPETRAAFGPVGSRYVPAVSGDDRLANRQSDADTFILRREKTFEYAIDILFGDAWAIVVNRKRNGGIRAEPGFDNDFSRKIGRASCRERGYKY